MKVSELPGDSTRPALIFFPEIVELQGLDEPVHIGLHATMHRATAMHKPAIRELLDPYIRSRWMWAGVNPWEHQEVTTDDGATSFKFIDDPDNHQFWMVSHWRRLFDLPLEHALELAEPGVTPVISLLNPATNSSGYVNSHAILNCLSDNILASRRVIGHKQIGLIERALKLLMDFEPTEEPSLAFIRKALRDFGDLKKVSKRMPLYVVGLFSIIESLLTTNQGDTTGKSLNYQLQEKLTLMNNRFCEPFDLANHFGRSSAPTYKTAIKKLYQYRSDIAHGNVSDFSRDLTVLENHQSVCEFLHALVRRLILQALEEPELMRDLKAC